MCTAATYKTRDFYFGRTFDYEVSYDEQIAVTPRNYPFRLRYAGDMVNHYAMIGMAHMEEGCPLYYEATNEKGLCMAGLNFAGNAKYAQPTEGKDNIASFEFIPWILGRCASLDEARTLLARTNVTDDRFNDRLPAAELHWIISDKSGSLVVECMADGMHVHDNPTGVMTNNPPFDEQMFSLNNYMALSAEEPSNNFCKSLDLSCYSRGMGAIGLPGDLSSMSRFARVAFVRANSVSGDSETESVSQFFHILGSVDQQRGCCRLGDGKCEVTIYTCCINASRGIFYYTSYDNRQISAVDMNREDLSGSIVVVYPLLAEGQIAWQN